MASTQFLPSSSSTCTWWPLTWTHHVWRCLVAAKLPGRTDTLWHASTVRLFWWALLARNAKHFRRSVGFTLKLPFCCPTNTGVDRFAGLASAHSLNFFFRVYLPSSNSTAWKGYISTFELSKQGVRLVSPGVNSLIIIQVRGATKHFDWEVPSSVVLPFLDPVRISNLGSFLPPFLAPWPDWVFSVTHWNACRHSWTGNQGFSWRSHSDASRWCLEQQAEKLDKDPGCHRCLLSNLGPQKSWKRTWRSGVCVAIAEPQANSRLLQFSQITCCQLLSRGCGADFGRGFAELKRLLKGLEGTEMTKAW